MKLTKKQRKALRRIIIAAVLFAAGIVCDIISLPWVPLILFVAAYIIVGLEVLIKAVRGILSAQLLDENFLMSIATVGAFVLGEFSEGVAVMLFYQIGELFQTIAVSRSRRSISELMDMRADYANLERGGEVVRVDPADVAIGDIIVIRPGEKVPIDGTVMEGNTALDVSALTGESMQRTVSCGDEVLSGSVNMQGLIRVKTAKPFGESTASKILELVENSAAKKSKQEAFITRFARVYTPAVVIAAVLLALVPSLITSEWGKWVYQGLNFLVISCPCALVISIPLTFFGGIGAASKCGILVKGSNYLEALANIDTVIFDKTGTLTEGKFGVVEILPKNISKKKLLELAAKAEAASSHPIARSIASAFGTPDMSDVTDVHEMAGGGVTCNIAGVHVAVGGARLMRSIGIDAKASRAYGTSVFVAIDSVLSGEIIVADKCKPNAKGTVTSLRALGVKHCVMLTGDNESVAKQVAKELCLDGYRAGLLPQDKVAEVEKLLEGGRCAFVGDGINDAPVLSRADIGIAMGGIGSDAAIEAADVVIMDDDPSKIAHGVGIARRTLRISRQNTVFALLVKGAVMLLGVLGVANMWLAVFADVGVSVLAILNAMRVQK